MELNNQKYRIMKKTIYEEPQLQVFQLEMGTTVLNNVSNENKNEEELEPII